MIIRNYCWKMTAGDWMLKFGLWKLLAGNWFLEIDCWKLIVENWLLDIDCWKLIDWNSLPEIDCWKLIAGDWLLETETRYCWSWRKHSFETNKLPKFLETEAAFPYCNYNASGLGWKFGEIALDIFSKFTAAILEQGI